LRKREGKYVKKLSCEFNRPLRGYNKMAKESASKKEKSKKAKEPEKVKPEDLPMTKHGGWPDVDFKKTMGCGG
jgi:hypothetical protein